MAADKSVYLPPLPIRIWHWLHAVCILVLIVTGAQIRFPDRVALIPSFRWAIELHNGTGLFVTILFFLWFFYYAIIGGTLGSLYLPQKDELRHGLRRQTAWYFYHFFRGVPNPHQPTPENRFDPVQKPLYLLVMLIFFPLQMITGMALRSLNPPWEVIDMFGNIKILMAMHFLIGCLLCAFLLTHIYLTTIDTRPWFRLKSMWHRKRLDGE